MSAGRAGDVRGVAESPDLVEGTCGSEVPLWS